VNQRRVVVTGMGLRSPLGATPQALVAGLQNDRCGVVTMPDWGKVEQLGTRLAGVCPEADINEKTIERKFRRSMGRVAIMATLSALDAVADAGLSEEQVANERCGISYGSTAGSSSEMEHFLRRVFERQSIKGSKSSTYLTFMSHTCAANLGIVFGCRGPLIASCTACTSGSQGVGHAYDAIRAGRADMMLAGGAEENHYMNAVVFDILMATSTRFNDDPAQSPRPFDNDRDGLVVAEGAGTLVLEEYEHAKKRSATIHGEILGFSSNCDGAHLTSPEASGMEAVMRGALRDAGLPAERIDYVCAHATATELGDIAESEATHSVFGDRTPVSSLKGFMGHTLGACGAIESIACLKMLQEGFVAPTRNLAKPDDRLAPLDHVMGDPRTAALDVVMNNNFAFGGINTSLIFGKCRATR
jgi:3-oxoacyl-[acyl-carrier-protein] synthase II